MGLAGRNFGHIRVDGILGHGGMGEVYEGFDERLARRVALKVLNNGGQLDDEARSRLIREARTLSKLDHPNICRIYDFLEDGEADVLVLEMIDGRTLQQAMNSGLSTAEKLRIARDVASVLVAAHRAGIVHRDLKPENVMLTKSGEVKVLDFGLARWTKRKSGSFPAIAAVHGKNAAPHRTGDSDPDSTAVYDAVRRETANDGPAAATAYGTTVGTPLYMSPEQARGEPLTTASDIYSFGLMLQTMFTGCEAYAEDLTAREVMLRAATGDSLPVTGVRRDVVALIKALKALAPSDRPTAGDALRRLQRIIDTPKRIARRVAIVSFVLVIVLAVWKHTVDLGRERTLAQKAEAEARQRRVQADSMLEFMLGDLRKKLEPLGRLDVLDDVGARALAYMSSLDPKTLTTEELAKSSKALYQLGEVRMGQGRLDEATKALTQSLAFMQTASRRAPADRQLQLELGTAHFWVGNAYQTRGDLPHALEHFTAYLDIAEALAKRDPPNAQYQAERAAGHGNVGSILERQGKLSEALHHYDIALSVKRALIAADPGNNQRRAELAMSINKIGYVHYKLADLRGARQQFDEEIALRRALVASDPKQAQWQERLGIAYAFLGHVCEDMGDAEAAAVNIDLELAIERRLVELDPTNAPWKRNLALGLGRLANLRRTQGHAHEAIALYDQAKAMLVQLRDRDRSRPSFVRDVAAIDTQRARALRDLGMPAAACAEAQAAVAALRSLPHDELTTRGHLALAEAENGDACAAAGDATAAAAAWQRAETILSESAGRSSEVRLLEARARVLFRLRRVDEAKKIAQILRGTGYKSADFVTLCNEGAF
jgi:serine/threonine-protein kinase